MKAVQVLNTGRNVPVDCFNRLLTVPMLPHWIRHPRKEGHCRVLPFFFCEYPTASSKQSAFKRLHLSIDVTAKNYFSASYWQASQSGLSIEQACGTGAACAKASDSAAIAATGADAAVLLLTALSVPVLIVDFSVEVAAKARR